MALKMKKWFVSGLLDKAVFWLMNILSMSFQKNPVTLVTPLFAEKAIA